MGQNVICVTIFYAKSVKMSYSTHMFMALNLNCYFKPRGKNKAEGT